MSPTASHSTSGRTRARTRRGRRLLRQGRGVHLLDLENLTGSPCPTTAQVTEFMTEYRELVPIGPMDQFVVAVNPSAGLSVGMALRGIQLLIRAGRDGADRALSESAYAARLPERFERVVIGSGDGHFTDLAAWLAGSGTHVTVVSRRGALNRRLYAAASKVVTFGTPTAQAA
ncbi:hypothetical protein AB0K60_12005 [Thermopolyspora sp. NPDC052614]|uniref:hypothetical protein n=1 Tax=Thermopolyspora sp. NPDC052614 TaxID=3155682 RepID=UPI003416C1C1